MHLARLLFNHALLILATGLVLIVAPATIPGFVGIRVVPGANLLSNLSGAAEVSLAILSYFGRRLNNRQALQLVCLTVISFHSLTAVVGMYAFTQGVSSRIWANVVVRVVVTALFACYGLRLKPQSIP